MMPPPVRAPRTIFKPQHRIRWVSAIDASLFLAAMGFDYLDICTMFV